ncbi:MAG: archease [Armatimonadetes bacterium]|nr:archease [Armatimonadota bacterium]
MAQFQFVPHTADIALRVWGRDLPDLLRAAALGLAAATVGSETLDAHRVAGVAPRPLAVAPTSDAEGLLVDFLNEVIFQQEVNREVYTDFEFAVSSPAAGIRALAYPDPSLTATHAVKAATYYDLRVARTPEGLEATVVFDV